MRALLGRHLDYARANTRPEEVYALDVDGLSDPTVTFFSYRVDGELLGVAAHGLRAAVSPATEGIYRARIEALDARLA